MFSQIEERQTIAEREEKGGRERERYQREIVFDLAQLHSGARYSIYTSKSP